MRNISKVFILHILILGVIFAQHSTSNESVSWQDALVKLKEGNTRFITSSPSEKHYLQEVESTVGGQHPYAVILTCSDSRVPPEILFDESIGRLFIIRVAGNIVTPEILGSIEYAAEHLGTQLLVILGHSKCGAVNAAVAGGEAPPNIASILKHIQPSINLAKSEKIDSEHFTDFVIHRNVLYQIKATMQESDVLKELAHKGTFHIAGALYNVSNGEVTFMPEEQTTPSNSGEKPHSETAPKEEHK